jgi:mRNA-degrading endonuclease RelE of RelBE toxin-antitoxin system
MNAEFGWFLWPMWCTIGYGAGEATFVPQPCERMSKFRIEFTAEAKIDLTWFSVYERRIIVDEVRRQLTDQPAVQTRNRKVLRDNPIARWELRVGKFRVFYEVGEDVATVSVGAVGAKQHNRLYIRGQEVRL